MDPTNIPVGTRPQPTNLQGPIDTRVYPDQIQRPAPVTIPVSADSQPSGVYSSPSLDATPYPQQSLQPQAVSGAATTASLPIKKGPNKLMLIIIAGFIILVVAGGVIAVISSKQKTKLNKVNVTPAGATQLQSVAPVQPIDLEQINNAISQDLSSLDDEKDFPAASLDDKTLGL